MSSPASAKDPGLDLGAREFLRALHVLFKGVRLYGINHRRTRDQLREAWSQLAGLEAARHNVVLGVAGQKLLVNGEHRELGPMESGFLRLLSDASISSIQFSPGTTADGLMRFAQIVSTVPAAEQLKTFEAEAAVLSGISVNRFRFVAQTGSDTEPLPENAPPVPVTDGGGHAVVPTMATGAPPPGITLPEAILAAMRGAAAGTSGSAENTSGVAHVGGTAEADAVGQVSGAAGWIVEMARKMVDRAASGSDALDESTRELLKRLLGAAPVEGEITHNPKALVDLAERMAIDFATQQFESGELKVDGVHALLEQLGKQIQDLRTVLNVQQEQMTRAGLAPTDMAEVLDRQFWASIPERGKQQVLLSSDAWCVPPRNVLQHAQEVRARGEGDLADEIVASYCKCAGSAEREARRKAAIGIAMLAEQVAQGSPETAAMCTRDIARQLVAESDPEIQHLLSTALVKIVQECCTRRRYAALDQALAALSHLEKTNAALANELRPRIRVENRVPEMIREAVHAKRCPEGLIAVLKRMPQASLKSIVAEFGKTGRSAVCGRLAMITHTLGDEAIEVLVGMLRTDAPDDAAATVGLLSALAMPVLQQYLGDRIEHWGVAAQATAVRQIAASGAEERGALLFSMLDTVHEKVRPLIIDEVGIPTSAGIEGVAQRMLQIASWTEGPPFLRVKAIEALGRMEEPSAIPLLRSLILAKKMFAWQHPEELRLAAWHALRQVEPASRRDPALLAAFKPAELAMAPHRMTRHQDWSRHRRYPRLAPSHTITGVASTTRGTAQLTVEMISLAGGVASRQSHAPLGGEGVLELQSGPRRVKAQVLVRELGARRIVFEFLDMQLADRWKLRQWLNPDLLAAGDMEGEPEPEHEAEPVVNFPDDPNYCR